MKEDSDTKPSPAAKRKVSQEERLIKDRAAKMRAKSKARSKIYAEAALK
jgi:hypothetical protein